MPDLMRDPTRNRPSADDRAFSQLTMLRISITTRPQGVTVLLEGRIAGPWVEELARCWKPLTAAQNARSIRVQLDAVTFVDAAGKALLRTMYEEGAALAASGCMTRAILEEVRKH
jgi:ABC-type transporter Mla MlaB component